MARSSRSLLDLPLPCRPEAAAQLAERLRARLLLEASSAALMSLLSAAGALWSLTLPEPLWARVAYSSFFAASSVLSMFYRGRRVAEARAVGALAERLARGEDPGWLCDATLGDLLARALEDYRRRVGRE